MRMVILKCSRKISSSQYFASEILDEYFEYGEEEYPRNKAPVGQNFEIEDYKITHLDSFEKPVIETFTSLSDDVYTDLSQIKIFPVVFQPSSVILYS